MNRPNVIYNPELNVFDVIFWNGRTKQIPGTSHTLRCSWQAIYQTERFLFLSVVGSEPHRVNA